MLHEATEKKLKLKWKFKNKIQTHSWAIVFGIFEYYVSAIKKVFFTSLLKIWFIRGKDKFPTDSMRWLFAPLTTVTKV